MSHAPTELLKDRHRAIREALTARSLDALVVTSLPNVLYLTNFEGSAAIAVVTGDRLIFITDFRYVTVLSDMRGTAAECPDLHPVVVEHAYDLTLAETLKAMPLARVGFEARDLSVARHQWLIATLGSAPPSPQLMPTEGIVEQSRVCKDRYELSVFREAGRRLSDVARQVFGFVARDRTERQIALDIDTAIRHAGFQRSAFETIVASGPNAALPHARAGERKLVEGDVVVLDFGGVYDSYCVDLTRTVSVGPASARARAVHAAVLRAHDRAIATCGPGQSRSAIDRAARLVLAEAGMADAFGHGTGHGLGIEVHEDPRISRPSTETDGTPDAVAAGMVFTIEPGAYFPGWGGVRIEDDIAVTEAGVELLTAVTTELLEI
jgi:Xaa-Pro aminopeptidase